MGSSVLDRDGPSSLCLLGRGAQARLLRGCRRPKSSCGAGGKETHTFLSPGKRSRVAQPAVRRAGGPTRKGTVGPRRSAERGMDGESPRPSAGRRAAPVRSSGTAQVLAAHTGKALRELSRLGFLPHLARMTPLLR